MVLCKFFLQGNCRYGANCRFEHTPPAYNPNYNQMLRQQQPQQPRGQPQSNPINSTQELSAMVQNDLQTAERGGQWLLSSYCPLPSKAILLPGMEDHSPEELRCLVYQAQSTGNVEPCRQHIQKLYQDAIAARGAFKTPSQTSMAILEKIRLSPVQSAPPPNPYQGSPPGSNPPPMYGASVQAQAQMSVFGGTSSPHSVFGGTPSQHGVFGGSSAAAPNPFGGGNAPQSTIFGGASAAPANPFGGASAAPTTPFGNPTAPVGTQATPFGNPSVPVGTQATPFGNPTAPVGTQATPFGNPTAPVGTQATPFGNPTAPASTQATPFGNPTAPVGAQGSMFGNSFAPSAQTSVFGGGAPGNVFGGSAGGGQESINSFSFASTAQGIQAAQTPSFLGSPVPQSSPFMGGSGLQPVAVGNMLGGSAQPAASIFGGAAATPMPTGSAPSIFGGAASGASVNPFGTPSTSAQQMVPAVAANDASVHTPLNELTEEERAEFLAPTFSQGRIPLRPPPQELCS